MATPNGSSRKTNNNIYIYIDQCCLFIIVGICGLHFLSLHMVPALSLCSDGESQQKRKSTSILQLYGQLSLPCPKMKGTSCLFMFVYLLVYKLSLFKLIPSSSSPFLCYPLRFSTTLVQPALLLPSLDFI